MMLPADEPRINYTSVTGINTDIINQLADSTTLKNSIVKRLVDKEFIRRTDICIHLMDILKKLTADLRKAQSAPDTKLFDDQGALLHSGFSTKATENIRSLRQQLAALESAFSDVLGTPSNFDALDKLYLKYANPTQQKADPPTEK